jgi:hypothetical protein
MKKLLRTFSVGLLIASITTFGLAQAPAPTAPGQTQNPARPEQPAMLTFEGELNKVDSSAKTITLKSGEKEMTFMYDDQTQIMGVDNGAQGLSGKTGSTLKVSYRDDKGSSRATKIEVQPKK